MLQLNFFFVWWASCFFSSLLLLSLLYWKQILTIQKVGAFIPSKDLFLLSGSVPQSYVRGSCWFSLLHRYTQRMWKKETLQILRVVSSLHRGGHRAQVSRVSWFVQDHMANQCLPQKNSALSSLHNAECKKETRCLIAVASHCCCLGVCPACLLGLSHYSLALFSWTLLNPPCLCPGKSDKGAFYFPAALCMQHSEKRGWQRGWGEEKTFVFQYLPDMKASLPGILRTS
jgi:hypothetical protein